MMSWDVSGPQHWHDLWMALQLVAGANHNTLLAMLNAVNVGPTAKICWTGLELGLVPRVQKTCGSDPTNSVLRMTFSSGVHPAGLCSQGRMSIN